MTEPEPLLRPVEPADLDHFFAQQRDPVARRMAAFTSADGDDRAAFDAHWARITADLGVVNRAIEFGGRVVGHVASFEQAGEREVTYWIDREHWGRGIATRALRLLLAELPTPRCTRVPRPTTWRRSACCVTAASSSAAPTAASPRRAAPRSTRSCFASTVDRCHNHPQRVMQEPAVQGVEIANVDTAQMRHAGKELLSLALMDARNHSLRWAAAFEGSPAGTKPLLRALGRLGWFQEHWIARNVQRQRGEHGDATRPKLVSILPGADAMFDSAGTAPLPDLQTIRQYLVDSLETTLELLEGAADDDDALYFYRLALLREDACVERFAVTSQTLGFDTGLRAPLATRPVRPPLLFPATRIELGSAPGGFVPDREKWAHAVVLPEFEIDSQAITWAQYGEFVEDGGYDDRRHWAAAGWEWVQAQGRRTPRFVDQMRQGVLQQRFGRLVRVPLAQPAMHVSWYEADAWCRWAGRRLPGEAEWEAAALQGATRGFRWGDVREWTAGTLRPYPGAPAAASPAQAEHPVTEPRRVLRGASFVTRGRLRHEKARGAEAPGFDEGFCGFRSCTA